jgi:DNA-binding CsgD family transcriptional regulator
MEADRTLLACALLAGDLTPRGIARYGEIDLAQARMVIAAAHHAGIMTRDGEIDQVDKVRLIAELADDVKTRIHTRAAQGLLAEGPDRLDAAVHHLHAAATLPDPEAALALADHNGRLSLSLGDYRSAQTLLALAADFDVSSDLSRQGHRLCDLAVATDGLGDLPTAQQHLARAVTLGELADEPALVARAAVAHTLPVDWHAGNPRTSGLLQRAASLPLTHADRVAVLAARALADMRIPVLTGQHQQVAWVTRPSVAQPLAEEALEASATCPPWVRCLAALAWRSTHRAPGHLARRRELSGYALALAQDIRHPAFQVEAAIWLAVDALESGDRALFDQALATARWVAHNDGNPRLEFRALTLAMGAALLDGDHDLANTLLKRTSTIVAALDTSLLLVVQTLFAGQIMLSNDDPTTFAALAPDPASDILAHPIGRSAAAYVWARIGQTELALEQTRRALVQRDDESSVLLVATRAAAVAIEVNDPQLCHDVIEILSPYANHVSVDSNGWWCDGPVALWLAALYHRLGNDLMAQNYLSTGQPQARALRDSRSLLRAQALHERLAVAPTAMQHGEPLTTREVEVLTLLSTGATNSDIAHRLGYSVSTIRNETMSLYRKLEVSGRPEAVARALALGVIRPRT